MTLRPSEIPARPCLPGNGAKSRVAVLGTLAALHHHNRAGDLQALGRIVKATQPDSLFAEITPDQWADGDIYKFAVEYRDVFVPICARSDVVLVPVGAPGMAALVVPRSGRLLGLRSALVRLLNAQLRLLQRLAHEPRALNSGIFGLVCNAMCLLTAWLCGQETQRDWEQTNQTLLENILRAARRDPGRRVLVTVDCRRRHTLARRLRKEVGIEVVPFFQL